MNVSFLLPQGQLSAILLCDERYSIDGQGGTGYNRQPSSKMVSQVR
jgi:hypothetical protein